MAYKFVALRPDRPPSLVDPERLKEVFLGRCRSVERFEKLNRLGEGTYGVVYRARDKASGEIVALKKVRMENENSGLPVSTLREIHLLKGLRHENVVALKEIAVGEHSLDALFLVLEYCEHDMAALIDNMKKPYSEPQIKCIVLQVLKGLRYCHEHYVIHRDLKLSNLLITSEGIIKIADFGLARFYEKPASSMTPKVVTLWYRAPELLFGTHDYTTAVDMWAMGCILGEFLLHQPLLPGKNEKNQLDLIIDLLGSPNNMIWPGYDQLPLARTFVFPDQPYNTVKVKLSAASAESIQLINKLLTYDPMKRMTVQEAIRHPYFDNTPEPFMIQTFPDIRQLENNEIQQRGEERAVPSRSMAAPSYQTVSFASNFPVKRPGESAAFSDARAAVEKKRRITRALQQY